MRSASPAAATDSRQRRRRPNEGNLSIRNDLVRIAQYTSPVAAWWRASSTRSSRTSSAAAASTAASVLSLGFTQPLLQGFGERIAREPLTQAERNVIYEMRDVRALPRHLLGAGGDRRISGCWRTSRTSQSVEDQPRQHPQGPRAGGGAWWRPASCRRPSSTAPGSLSSPPKIRLNNADRQPGTRFLRRVQADLLGLPTDAIP